MNLKTLTVRAGHFAVLQIALQLVTAVTGILLIWLLDKPEYAIYIVASQFVGALSVLSDSGVGSAVLTLAGRKWPDMRAVSVLVTSAIRCRRILALAFALVLAPMLVWVLHLQGTPWPYALAVAVVALSGIFLQLSSGVLATVPRLAGDFHRAQIADLTGIVLRLIVIGALIAVPLVPLNALLAVSAGLVGTVATYVVLARFVRPTLDASATVQSEETSAIAALTRSQIATAIFYCVQGQIAIWIISFSGTTSAIADVGALSRLAVVFNLLVAAMSLIIVPRISKSRDHSEIVRNTALAFGSHALFSGAALAAAWIMPGAILFVLGPKYRHLEAELFLMILVSVGHAAVSTLWLVITSRGWVRHSWLNIPLVIGTQLAVAPLIDFRQVSGVLIFSVISVLPTIVVFGALLLAGLRQSSRRQLQLALAPE